MFFSVSLDNIEFFLWFAWFFNALTLSLSITNFCDWLHLHKTSSAIQSHSFIQISSDNETSLFFNRFTFLLCSSIIYVNTMCIKFVLTLHTLICLLVAVYSTKMSFHVHFRFNFMHFSFSMWMYKTDSNIQIWLKFSLISVQTFSEVTVFFINRQSVFEIVDNIHNLSSKMIKYICIQ